MNAMGGLEFRLKPGTRAAAVDTHVQLKVLKRVGDEEMVELRKVVRLRNDALKDTPIDSTR